ncbi:MAG: lipopolysaccharide biosynthesis protein [Pirellulaceae bacterium]
MTTVATNSRRNAGDAFAIGVIVMLLVNVLQRSVGFLRGVGFARFLSDVELGQWALLNSFLLIAVPIASLGFPGSFGKFVEYFRNRDQLRTYVRTALLVAGFGVTLFVAGILFGSQQFAWFVFGVAQPTYIVSWCILCLFSAILFSFSTELASGFRQVKAVSAMHFTQSLAFAVVGLSFVAMSGTWWVLMPSYCIANTIALIPGWWRLTKFHGAELRSAGDVSGELPSVWRRVLPYAVSLWVMNLLGNLFEVSDRYMLLHLSIGSESVGQALVGQYHCARILPNLLISVAMTLGGILMPYLSMDWEAKRTDAMQDRMRQLLQAVCVAFLAFGTVTLIVSPLLFEVVMEGRYEIAHSLLPLACAQAIWFSLYLVSEPFMLCIEKGRILALQLACCIALNLGLNWYLIPPLGLHGAMLATTTANVCALSLLYSSLEKHGCRIRFGPLLLSLTPISLLWGPVASMACLVAIVFLAGRTDLFFDDKDRRQIDQLVTKKLQKLGLKMETIWPKA